MPGASPPVELPYTEIAPPADLAPYVDRLWLRTTVRGEPGRVHRVLPDGCVDVIVHADRGSAELVGTMTRALEVADGPAQMVAVRFNPGTAAAVARCSLAELTDREADVAELGIAGGLVDRVCDLQGRRPATPLSPKIPLAAAPLSAKIPLAAAPLSAKIPLAAAPLSAKIPLAAAPLSAKIPLAAADHARITALVAWLREQLAGAPPPDPRVARAVALLSSGEARVDEVAGMRLVVCAETTERCDALLFVADPIRVPSLASRQHELPRIVDAYADDARADLGLAAPFMASHRSWVTKHCASLPEIALATRRLVALQRAGTVAGAADLLGMGHTSLGEWLQRRRDGV